MGNNGYIWISPLIKEQSVTMDNQPEQAIVDNTPQKVSCMLQMAWVFE